MVLAALISSALAGVASAACDRYTGCDSPEVGAGRGSLTAAYVDDSIGVRTASNTAPPLHPYTYRLTHPCVWDDSEAGGCRSTDFYDCAGVLGRVVEDLVFERRPIFLPGAVYDTDITPPTAELPAGTQFDQWRRVDRGCIDITALNPAPTPDEVFRYFQTLPLPQLPTRQQPPGNGLVGLPVIFFTDGPTTQAFTLDIRGFTVDITATASSFTWRTGDGTELTTTDPGAPYPDHTISHDYAGGTWTAALTTTWTGTFSIDGGLTVPVPGSTTTDGPPVTFDVLQARPVLTNPFD